MISLLTFLSRLFRHIYFDYYCTHTTTQMTNSEDSRVPTGLDVERENAQPGRVSTISLEVRPEEVKGRD